MDDEIRARIVQSFQRLPEECRHPPAIEAQLRGFERDFGAIPPEYRWFLQACGGGVVGGEWVDGIAQLLDSHHKFRREPWTMRGVFVIGWDGAGNPFGIETSTNRVLVEDHTFGGIYEMAPSFAKLLIEGLAS